MQEYGLLTHLVESMHCGYKAGEDAASEFWYHKALAQLYDITIYHPEDAKADKAVDIVLTREALLTLACIAKPLVWLAALCSKA